MRRSLSFKLPIFAIALTTACTTYCQNANSFSNGLQFENPSLQSGSALQVGAKYLFSNVKNNVDAVVSIDSLVNGAEVNKIDDNSNGTGYKEAFQPAIQAGGVIGESYAVFTIKFYLHSSTTLTTVPVVYATALDIDGNNTLKEFARINVGNGGIMNYLAATPDIAVSTISGGYFMAANILGIERTGIDTSALANMFTATNYNVSSFTVKYGTITTNPSNAVRQYSLYLNQFNYGQSVLPVKLASFTATLNNSKTSLNWTTASEIDLSHFAVERSTDGVNFSEAGIVFAVGSMSEKTNYSFSDDISRLSASVIYYRLRSVDNDGKAEYSQVRVVRIGNQKENEIKILTYPNPVTNELRVTVPANWQNKKVVYEIYQVNGMLANRVQSSSSSQTESINVSNLSSGIYIVKVNCDGQTAQQRIVKQ